MTPVRIFILGCYLAPWLIFLLIIAVASYRKGRPQ